MNQQLAQINIANIIAPMDSPVMVGFVNNLDNINALAESSEGFIWRLKGEGNDATSLRIYNNDFFNCEHECVAGCRYDFQLCL